MNRWTFGISTLLVTTALACGGGSKESTTPANGGDMAAADQAAEKAADQAAEKAAADPNEQFGPLGVGADWQSYTKVNTTPVMSQDHGKRFVDTYVNEVGQAAYQDPDEEAEIPVGTIIVKTSWENEGGKPSTTAGPTFVMEKKEPGYDPDKGDWYYAIHWENPPEKMRQRFGSIYWQSPSKKVDYCVSCHEGYDRQLGMVPEEHRAF